MQTSRFWLLSFLVLFASNAQAFSTGGAFAPAGQRWEKINSPSASLDFRILASQSDSPDHIFAASDSEVFENVSGRGWSRLWQTASPSAEISKLLLFKNFPGTLFILSTEGLYAGDLQKRNFEQIFSGATRPEQSVLSLALNPENPEHRLLGTESGLFESQDGGKIWSKHSAFGSDPIPLLYFLGNRLFVGSGQSLFVTEDLKGFRKVLDLPASAAEIETGSDENYENFAEDAGDNEGPEESSWGDLTGNRILWIGTRRGVFESRDGGLTWQALSPSGLRNTRITSLLYHERTNRLFAGTPAGVYSFDFSREQWTEIFQGLEQPDIRALAASQDPNPVLFAATESGISYYPLTPEIRIAPASFELSPEKARLFRELIAREPSFREFQKAVIRYNDLDDGKIRRWQAASRLRALLPSFSFGRDFSSGRTIDSERTSTYSPIKYVTGPDDITRSWDINVSWNAGDLLWNSAQTAIDSRGKIDAEFRRDLLSEATRIYYERRRLQMEIIGVSETEQEERFEKLIRLDELTALLDTFSGGYFSARLEPLYDQRPELNNLWLKETT